jgi:hypothetical protein
MPLTRVDLRRKVSAFDQAVLQLFRFHILASAINRSPTKRANSGKAHLAYTNATLGDGAKPRRAVLRVAGHPILRKVAKPLAESFSQGKHNYVLMLDRIPKGIGDRQARVHFRTKLAEYHQILATWCEQNGLSVAPQPDCERFWYVYWEGDLKDKYVDKGSDRPDPLKGGGYMRTASSRH